MTTRLIYVADPMCSWCWGFAPELDKIRARFDLSVEVVVGGLRPGPAAQPLDSQLGSYLRATWNRIAELTGQPFDPTPLAWEGWIYDSELPARAVVVARSLQRDAAVSLFSVLQQAFYADATDITDPDEYPALIAPLGLDPEEFRARLTSDQSREAAWQDFRRARSMGVGGFPALFVDTSAGQTAVTLGYRPADAIAPLIERALDEA